MQQSKASLLLVDDDTVLRQTLSASLSALGYRVRSAGDGFEALDAIREEMPALILSDLQIPGMSGFELLYIVQRRFPAIRVVAMSGAYSGDAIPEGVAAHAFHAKGTSPRFLFQTIGSLAEHSRESLVTISGTPALRWIARNIHDCSGEAYLLIGCPECLRAFPELLTQENAIHESSCVYCGTCIRYAIVPGTSPFLAVPPSLRLRADDVRERLPAPPSVTYLPLARQTEDQTVQTIQSIDGSPNPRSIISNSKI